MVTKRATELELVGGAPILDLANTLDGPRDGEPGEDYLREYGDLVGWAAYAGILDDDAAKRLARRARDHPRDAAGVLAGARALRAAAYATFRAVADGGSPPQPALDALAAADAQALAHARLSPSAAATARRFEHTWDGDALERVLWPLAHSAVDLLGSGPLDRVKACAECRWLFVDTSRNRSRRWCSMNECGGRLKMRRYRARRATEGR